MAKSWARCRQSRTPREVQCTVWASRPLVRLLRARVAFAREGPKAARVSHGLRALAHLASPLAIPDPRACKIKKKKKKKKKKFISKKL
eukprot:NODE_6534_length_498_cov_263.297968.p1 GENE.NODE_6534_length_498_cov_263.297968~~NODE_6534_length_498_cov_263.297968.p1  ORF type:complete len:88 (-),score=27.60 NODE_6534_length_498_cov_263.297968:28-291(-)